MQNTFIANISRDAWAIIDKLDMRYENHTLSIVLTSADDQTQRCIKEPVISIIYAPTGHPEKATAAVEGFYFPVPALEKFEVQLKMAAMKDTSIGTL